MHDNTQRNARETIRHTHAAHRTLRPSTMIGSITSITTPRRAFAGATALSLSLSLALALGACGGGSIGEASDSGVETSSPEAHADVEAATLAAQSATVPLALSLKMNTDGLETNASNGRFIVKYRSGSAEGGSTSAVQSRLQRLSAAFPSKARHVRRTGVGADVLTTERKLNMKDAKAFMRAIASDPNVEYIEADREMSTAMAPNDPDYTKQWSLSSNQKAGNSYPGIRAEGAWDLANGAGSVIAVVDNGVTSHGDLNPNMLPGFDFLSPNRGGNGTNPGVTTETCVVDWHGTHVAGIAAALTNNGYGIAGVAPNAKVLPVRVMNACGRGYTSDIADGIVWAAGGTVSGAPVNANPAKVINLSLGGLGGCETTLQNALDFAASRGVTVVAAAGNNATSATNFSPANCRNVISVGGSNRWGSRWVDSNFGPTVDLAAPGDSIWSTYNNGTRTPGTEGYAFASGTSMSAPAVSGVIALIQSVAPTPLTPAELRTLLTQNVQPFIGKLDQPIGTGILDATAAVVAARQGRIPAAANFSCRQSSQLMHVSCTDLSSARGAPIRSWVWNFGAPGGDTASTKSTNPELDFEQPGTYEFTLTVTDANGFVSKVTRRVDVAPMLVTDITDAFDSVRFPMNASDKQYFSVSVPPQPFSKMVLVGAKSLTFTLAPDNARDVATLSMKFGTASMVNPACTSVMAGGQAAVCTAARPTSGTYYVMVSSPAPIGNVSIKAVMESYFP
ncbi:S8 family serine peptidase [Paraburkholderia sp. D15]|uniref:S8 family serine peptidase n=1 Tax=Paraburkholderia sp. D15 TaxID=2880218 RepID=UPI00247A555E|nr:S8 family serine peptidase [Paraburkholderia sp. D15]WGS52929.1 S8 family serine peptidase [Paraburkholderia sp. D15]